MGCSDPNTNQAKAAKLCGSNSYAPVGVTILKASATSIEFRAASTGSAGSAGAGTYEANWGDVAHMWTPCPSTLKSLATPTNLTGITAVGETGTLYLSAAFLLKNPTIPAGEPKWPTRLASAVECLPLNIAPTSITIAGTELDDGNFFFAEINMMDPDLALIPQSFDSSGGPLTLQLTAAGFELFHAVFAADKLDAALATIQDKKDAVAIAGAWNVVAVIVKWLSMQGTSFRISDDQRTKLLSLLPGLQIPTS